MNSFSKRHHYIPQFILRNFADDESYLHCIAKHSPEHKYFRTTPKNVFLETNLYTEFSEDGTRSTQAETKLSQIEGKFSEVITKIVEAVRSGGDPAVEPSDEDVLREFINLQINRHPEIKETLRNLCQRPGTLQSYVERWLGRPLNNAELEALNEFRGNRLADRVFTDTMNVPDDAPGSWMPDLKQQRIGICKIGEGAGEFVIGDKQIVIIPSETGDRNLMSPGVWLLYPISYDVGVLWGLMDWEKKRIIFADPRWVCDINQESFRTSQSIVAGRSERQIRLLLS